MKVPSWIDNAHHWMYYHFGKPKFCEICKTEKAKYYDWANISGEYLRIREDWLRLCRQCHHDFDGDKLDQNRRINKNNTSGYKGVNWHKQIKRWRASIMKNNKTIFLGTFISKIDAAKAYNEAAIELFGKNAWQNKI